MQHFRSLEDVGVKGAWITIGSFDGVHFGHQEIIRRLISGANIVAAPTIALTFHPHPKTIVRQGKDHQYLTTPEERAALLGDLGIDAVITLKFDERVAAMSARDFMSQLFHHLKISQLWVGYDFALGKDRLGNVSTLSQLGDEFGYLLHEIPAIKVDGEIVSSSLIRSLLRSGEIKKANALLGRPYQICGNVGYVEKDQNNSDSYSLKLGVWEKQVIPQDGVYATEVEFENIYRDSFTVIGNDNQPEAKEIVRRVTIQIPDFVDNAQGKDIRVNFIERSKDAFAHLSENKGKASSWQEANQKKEILNNPLSPT